MKKISSFYICCSFIVIMLACTKKGGDDGNTDNHAGAAAYSLTYGDSVVYLKDNNSGYTIKPALARTDGVYTAFPDGLEINAATGEINIQESETGLRYRITFTSTKGEVFKTMLLVSGINYIDKYYRLAQGDSLALPVYNATPGSNTTGVYDVNGTAAAAGIAIDPATGAINLSKTMRNGFLNYKNDERKDIEIKYKLNDKSNQSTNSIKVLLYYYKNMSDVPTDLKETVTAHLGMMLKTGEVNGIENIAAKPRPPCVIIVGN